MSKLSRDTVVAEALAVLDEKGLAGVTTRALARRLGVEQPALYWHFPNKAALLEAMADVAVRPHALRIAPAPPGDCDWRAWFVDNTRSFRHTLLAHREGARLHAGSRPGGDAARQIEERVGFLKASGFAEADAVMALLSAGRFTLGCVLEEQADQEAGGPQGRPDTLAATGRSVPSHAAAFEAGLDMLVEGFARRLTDAALRAPSLSQK